MGAKMPVVGSPTDKHTYVRLQYLKSKIDGTIELHAVDYNTKVRYEIGFYVNKAAFRETLQELATHVIIFALYKNIRCMWKYSLMVKVYC